MSNCLSHKILHQCLFCSFYVLGMILTPADGPSNSQKKQKQKQRRGRSDNDDEEEDTEENGRQDLKTKGG